MNTIPPHISLHNQWRIPRELAVHVACRDLVCIYCGNEFAPIGPIGRRRASWEHIVNDLALLTPENIAVCCVGCNASKGTKSLHAWLQSVYCAKHNINEGTLALVARAALIRQLTSAATTQNQSLAPISSFVGSHSSSNTAPSENVG